MSRNEVSDNEIRDAYKTLSRRLHPDKRPPGRERDDAQEIFTELLNACELLDSGNFVVLITVFILYDLIFASSFLNL